MAGFSVKGTRFSYATPSQLLTIRFLAGAAGFKGMDDPEFRKILKRIAKVETPEELSPARADRVIEVLKGRI
ncbi:hypothetical protein [Burkholderia cepacia]|uniref:hypothetical protein n=1 Tax=Burkholderia cepacia TaxID=292 RepID=UPI003EE24DEE